MRAYPIVLVLTVVMMTVVAGCGSGPGPNSGADSSEEGVASYYGSKFQGRPTASGEIYDQTALTAAHPKLPFGTLILVTNLSNGKKLELRVNDRGPFVEGRILDVSYRAAEELGFVREGLARVRVEVLRTGTATN